VPALSSLQLARLPVFGSLFYALACPLRRIASLLGRLIDLLTGTLRRPLGLTTV